MAAPKDKIQQDVRDRVAWQLQRLLDQRMGGNKMMLSRLSKISRPYIDRILAADTSASIDTLERLAIVLDVDVITLLQPAPPRWRGP